jgi:hypothetical protein
MVGLVGVHPLREVHVQPGETRPDHDGIDFIGLDVVDVER